MSENKKNDFKQVVISATIENNVKALYRLSKRHINMNFVFNRYKRLKKFLLLLLRYLKNNRELIEVYNNSLVISLNNEELTEIRKGKRESDKRESDDVTNRYMNYLCLCGFFCKVKQLVDVETGVFELTERNKRAYYKNHKARKINTFQLLKYDKETLDAIEKKIAELHAAGVTPGNISSDMLEHNVSLEQANEQYPTNKSGMDNKTKVYQEIVKIIDSKIAEQGFCYKSQMFLSLRPKGISYVDAVKTMRVFKKELAERYRYKPLSKREKEMLGVNTSKWVYVRSGGELIDEKKKAKKQNKL